MEGPGFNVAIGQRTMRKALFVLVVLVSVLSVACAEEDDKCPNGDYPVPSVPCPGEQPPRGEFLGDEFRSTIAQKLSDFK